MSVHVCKCEHNGRTEYHIRYPGLTQQAAQALADNINSGQLVGADHPLRTGQHGGHSCTEKLREELDITDKLLAERERVLRAIPECPVHGAGCVPHALEWIERAKAAEEARKCAGAIRGL